MKKLLAFIAMLIIGLTSNPLKAQTNVSGLISSNTNWTIGNHPYIVTGNILVNNGVTLTIEPGVIVKFNSGLSMQIDGELLAQGTSNNKITFTSNTADTAGAWGYIYFSDASVDAVFENNIYGNYISGSILEYCILQYAGGISVTDNGALRLDNAHPFVNYCIVSENNATGIRAYNLTGSLKISNSAIINNTSSDYGGGINIGGGNGGNIVINSNTISKNTVSNIYGYGGGINNMYNINGTTFISNNTITENTAGTGGGISSGMSGGNSAEITNNIIKNNIASDGGGIYIYYGSSITSGNIITNNRANRVGGIFAYGGSGGATISNNVISDNSSTSTYGGIWTTNASLPIHNNHIVRNTAADNAGIYSNYISNNDFKFNIIAYNKNTDYNNTFNRCIYIEDNAAINNNNIFNNSAFYELYNGNTQGSANVDGTNNWWGTENDAEIQAKIYDWFDDNSLGIVNYSPYLTAPDTAAPLSPPANAIKTDLGGGQVQITWLPNPESDVAGYHVYYGGFNGYSFTNVVDIGNNTTYIIPGITITDTIAVTVYDNTYDPLNDYDSTIVNDNMTNGNESWFTFAVDTSTTGVTENNLEMPESYVLSQNYPNPFNPSTTISWQTPVSGWQTLKVYDVLGTEVTTLIDEFKPAGRYDVDFNASGLSSAVYFYRLTTGSFTGTKKLILIK